MPTYRVWVHSPRGGDDTYMQFSSLAEAYRYSRRYNLRRLRASKGKKFVHGYAELPLLVKGRGLLKSKEFQVTKKQIERALKQKRRRSKKPRDISGIDWRRFR